ncbi:hypothetical protein SHK09_00925 [Polaribacter sp. PL03]|uniref:hypothetical protein n=1 Tax=Polaribacter sp. PL03 TaxID=3088353 RepID=UPI0029CAF103|nr:hypothetical protein [Polaribacter sp. PL03]MDX6745337.1 hypothetical protein [Polaribacter sp. PL03]
MKKIFYLFAITAFVFTSCNPLEDVNEEVDALTANDALVDDLVLTLTDEDYTTLELNFGNFSSEEDAKEMLPGFLSAKYPQLGATFLANGDVNQSSSALVTYKLFNKKNDEKSFVNYTVSAADYTAQGLSFPNFSSLNQITAFLDTKYPSAENRLLVDLTYDYYNGTTSTLNNGFINNSGTWEMSIGISDDEYTAMGEGRAQFSSEDEAFVKIPLYLKNKLSFEAPVSGRIEGVMYKLYDSSARVVKSYVAFFIYDGATWTKYNNVINETIKLGHNGVNWVPDNTIKVTLSNADYTLVGNGFFNNFDLRSGKDEETVEQRLAKINTILKNNYPSAVVGQKFAVTYAFYDGSNGNATLNVVLEGSDYVLQ